jgi:hypothetical protein
LTTDDGNGHLGGTLSSSGALPSVDEEKSLKNAAFEEFSVRRKCLMEIGDQRSVFVSF